MSRQPSGLVAEETGIEIRSPSLELTGHCDARGVFGGADVALPFPEIDLTVDITINAGTDQAMEPKATLAKRCPVSVILGHAGALISETWNVTESARS